MPSILIVDDDSFVLEASTSLLKEHGYTVIPCNNVKDAIVQLQVNKIDVVLTDVRMPEVSGIELLEKIQSCNLKIPVIMMTAYTDINVALAAMGKGAFDFIIKPYKPELLIHSIETAIKQKRRIS